MDFVSVSEEGFEIQSAPVTRFQFGVVVGYVPDLTSANPQSSFLTRPLAEIDNPDHPVTMLSTEDLETFLRTLNDWSISGDPRLADVMAAPVFGAIYRLPSKDERIKVENETLGIPTNDLTQADVIEKIKNQGVFRSRGKEFVIHRNQTKPPLKLDNQSVYDLFGNTWEIVTKETPENTQESIYENLRQDHYGHKWYVRGGYSGLFIESTNPSFTHLAKIPHKTTFVGIRLLRYLPKDYPILKSTKKPKIMKKIPPSLGSNIRNKLESIVSSFTSY